MFVCLSVVDIILQKVITNIVEIAISLLVIQHHNLSLIPLGQSLSGKGDLLYYARRLCPKAVPKGAAQRLPEGYARRLPEGCARRRCPKAVPVGTVPEGAARRLPEGCARRHCPKALEFHVTETLIIPRNIATPRCNSAVNGSHPEYLN